MLILATIRLFFLKRRSQLLRIAPQTTDHSKYIANRPSITRSPDLVIHTCISAANNSPAPTSYALNHLHPVVHPVYVQVRSDSATKLSSGDTRAATDTVHSVDDHSTLPAILTAIEL